MTEKNKAKQERKAKRKMWNGLYVRKTKTKREKEESLRKKHKGRASEQQPFLFCLRQSLARATAVHNLFTIIFAKPIDKSLGL